MRASRTWPTCRLRSQGDEAGTRVVLRARASLVLLVCVLWIGLALGGSRTAAQEADWGTWAEAVRKHHPLAGGILAVGEEGPQPGPSGPGLFKRLPANTVLLGNVDAKLVTGGVLFHPRPPHGRGLVAPRGIVLLGEIHDNPAHHQVRAWLITNSRRTLQDWQPAIVFEHIRSDQQAALDQFYEARKGGRATADDLFRLLDWEKSGWPSAEIYKPLFEAALAANLRIYAGDAPRERVQALARGTPLPDEERSRLGLDKPMPQPLLEALAAELKDSHCGMLPDAALPRMSLAQRYRDAHLADVVLEAASRHGSAILIAGNGHVRSDRGVPWYVRQRSPQTPVESVMTVEVEEDKLDPLTYLPRRPDGRAAAAMLIFTPRHERPDPCGQMRKQFQRKSSEPPK
jgi:uncharacterized iron-regulated protein